ncbi:alcohol dehydrogenase GroES-like domain-containing protein [Colletotrichum abscissum]|uniref:Alcohol dehydrogenase GroES-like domain-containing protein n=2 Tax=Colletotrichum acutatum species complex TaxID=2707335 RepID=A0A9P9XBG7_9PEZI|nr:alcohol dehydrogenase GroES-like domain-containing protein [Colletotrichum tamarilloi]XP_060406051.1 alcohol dehydrogenase GroES-like domain-containing protein [Colletotrichum abscissum]KAI3535602.1 alcohol dehydrogenase GroES-like domain-containing protein [Colletotrichum filicis]KAI3547208.1 alcohol dehydrogenase GroES-like domain-containing protein [Colletotrichum abscissum]KAK1509972.1 alcohol dehydrogenase GroES-like domain-containing protein [Colletotrichum tamarilloi]KAK1525065.1 alc
MSTSGTMRAVVFNGPRSVSVEQRPIPTVQDDGDVIVKVQATALCGSELHVFRGHQPSETGFIMGHEFTGTVIEKGAAVTSLNIGDRVVSPFTSSCMNCFYCKNGYTSRCARSKLFGCGALDGGQAEYVRIPDADGTAMKAPTTISDNALVLMADIFPTGFFGAKSGFNLLKEEERSNATAVVIGCGPVGLCAVISALEYRPKHLFAIDSVDSRLELARGLGAEPLNFKTDRAGMEKRIKEVTDGRGADVVIEVVGLSPALRTAFDIIRPFGVIASIGVHNGEIPWTGTEAYGKNLRLQMGRCPVRAIFPEALALLEKKQDKLGFMFDRIMPLSEAVEGYALFDQMKVQKVIFTP